MVSQAQRWVASGVSMGRNRRTANTLQLRAVNLKWPQSTKNLTPEGAPKAAETLNSKQQFVGWYTLGFGAHGSYRQSPCEWRDRDDRDRRRFGERESDPSGRARIARCHSAPEHISAAIRRSAKGARPGPPGRLCWYGLGHCQERG